jgi:hypothetical protein
MNAPVPATTGRPAESNAGSRKQAYDPPRLVELGGWTAVTLQQSVPIFP